MVEFPVKIDAKYEAPGSRAELFIRIVYCFVLGIIASIWGFFAGIAVIVQWWYILFVGKKHQSLWDFTASYYRFYARFMSYCLLLTDARPPFSGG
ncbi:MAG: DUF4389 domain-containing protein [archaeon]|nr:DUF4389 domain-containing protein [Candidatus Micrarchaeota archaeon]